MKPSQTAEYLRRIATRIDNSKNPDRVLVAKELRRVLVAVSSGEIVVNQYDNTAIKTSDVRGQLKKWFTDLVSKGQEIVGVEGDTLTLENIDSQLASVADDMLGEAFDGFLVTSEEGSEGIGMGFSSADRQAFTFPWPEALSGDEFLGNGDPTIFRTTGAAPGAVIPGEDGVDNPAYLEYCKRSD